MASRSSHSPAETLSLSPALHSGVGGDAGRPQPLSAESWTTFFRNGAGSLRQQFSRRPPSQRSPGTRRWWQVRLFRGMVHDIRRRAPYYWSDWRDAWDYRVVPATVYMYFAKYDPPGESQLTSFPLVRCSFLPASISLAR